MGWGHMKLHATTTVVESIDVTIQAWFIVPSHQMIKPKKYNGPISTAQQAVPPTRGFPRVFTPVSTAQSKRLRW